MIKKAFVLSANNWKVMLKALFCQVLILALMSALCFLIFGGLVEDCIEIFSSVDWSGFLENTFNAIANAEFNAADFSAELDELISQTREVIESIPNIWNRVEVSYVICIVMFLVYRMLISFSDVSAGCQIQEFMTSNSSRPFTWYFVKKFIVSLKFASLQTLLALPLDFFIVISGLGICLALAIVMGWWSVVPAVLIMVTLYSARQAYFAFWLPTVVTDEMGVRKSLTKSVSVIPYRFWHVFWKTLAVVCVMAACFVLSVVYVQNSILKLFVSTVPNLILFFILKCVNFVEYFEATKRPYFYKKVDVEGTERFNKKYQRATKRNGKADAKNR